MQSVSFEYYDAVYGAVTPLATPLDGGTRFVVQGANMGAFAVGTMTGAANIYGVPSQIRTYDALPVCFLGSRERWVPADLEACSENVEGWMAADLHREPPITSGCSVLRCGEGEAGGSSTRSAAKRVCSSAW